MSSLARPWILERALRTPGATALAGDGGRVSFGGLAERGARAAAGLAFQGVGPGDLVAVRLRRGLHAAVALHAASLLGVRILFVHPRLTESEVAGQLGDARADLFLDGADALAACEARGGRPPGLPRHAADEVAWVLFTSGTSGRPKAAMLTWANLSWSAKACAAHLAAARAGHPGGRRRRGGCWLACLPLYHVGGLSILVRSVLSGAPVLLHDAFDPERVSHSIDCDGVAFVSLVPTTLRRLLEARGGRPAPPDLQAVLLGGAAAPPELVSEARALGFPVLPSYGLTETASQVATAQPGDPPAWVGRPLLGTRIRITDGTGRPLPVGREGEIRVQGPTVFAGYLHAPEATAAALEDGWLRTGDIGVVDAAGRLRVLERRADLVVSGGENVYPAEVEAVLLAHPQVLEAAVAGRADPDLGQRVAAWVVPRAGCRPDPQALLDFCRQRIAGYKVPREIHWVAALPRSSLGKVARRELSQARSAQGDALGSSPPERL